MLTEHFLSPQVKDLYHRFISTTETDTDARSKIANSIIKELAVHAVAEEVVIYPAIEHNFGESGRQIAEHNRAEHMKLKQNLQAVDMMKVYDDGYGKKLQEVIAEFNRHASEEEQTQMPQLKQKLGQEESVKLGTQFETIRASAPTHPHPSAPDKGGMWEAVVGMVTKPMDKLFDMTRSFEK
ncbi:hypothetical protein HK098_002185 [Nowakowskiella sp. JEL0407]|nr:hypothetical protein HK098_002185 [Nowakowskiella sp. JEL0407]